MTWDGGETTLPLGVTFTTMGPSTPTTVPEWRIAVERQHAIVRSWHTRISELKAALIVAERAAQLLAERINQRQAEQFRLMARPRVTLRVDDVTGQPYDGADPQDVARYHELAAEIAELERQHEAWVREAAEPRRTRISSTPRLMSERNPVTCAVLIDDANVLIGVETARLAEVEAGLAAAVRALEAQLADAERR